MIRVYCREFVTICEYLERGQCRNNRLYFYVEKEELKQLLDRNHYETSNNKLKLWKALRWLDADDKHLTKLVFDGESGKRKRIFALRIDVYRALKPIIEATKT